MEKPVIQVSSVTYAMKGRDILFHHGIRAYVERSTRSSKAGCGYSLYVPEKTDEAEEILRRELDGLDDEFETLRLLSQELSVRANGLRFRKAA